VAATTAVVAGTAGAVSHHQQQKYANKQEQEYAEQQAQQQAMDQAAAQAVAQQQAQAAPAAAPQDETMAKIQQLAELNKQGILSDEEFAAAKAKLLGI